MASPLPANVNLIQLLAASPGTTIVGTEPLESVQSGTSVAFTLNQVLTFAQTNFSVGNLAPISGLSVLGVIGTANATPAAIAGTTDQVLRIAQGGTTLGFGPINLATTAAVTGILAGANMTAVNLATTGAGAVQNTLPVASGGMGTASLSAYAALFAGTTATAALQQAIATTAGYPLVANGSTSLAGFKALNLAGAGVTGILPSGNFSALKSINVTTFNGGTWNYVPSANLLYADVQLLAGGGAGGGTPANSTATLTSAGGGGAAGGYSRGIFTSGQLGTAVTIVVGAAGVAVNGTTGGSGGNSTFKTSLLTTGGGAGGPAGAVGFTVTISGGAAGGAAGGSGAYLTLNGQGGWDGWSFSNLSQGGAGGQSVFGAGATVAMIGIGGIAGVGANSFGSGGGGAAANGTATAQTGGGAGSGFCVITEFIGP